MGDMVHTPSGALAEVRRIIPRSAHHPGGVVVAGTRWLEESNGQSARRIPFVRTHPESELER